MATLATSGGSNCLKNHLYIWICNGVASCLLTVQAKQEPTRSYYARQIYPRVRIDKAKISGSCDFL